MSDEDEELEELEDELEHHPRWDLSGSGLGSVPRHQPAQDPAGPSDPIDPPTESLEPFHAGELAPSAEGPALDPRDESRTIPREGTFSTPRAPAPVGAYPHARKVGELLFLSGVGPRQPGTNEIPGGPICTPEGEPRDYDAAAQTRAVIENVKVILEDAGSSLDKVVDVTAFLIDMDRDFTAYNGVYAEYFRGIQATRTTIAIRALPTPIAVEFKVIALP